MKKTIWTKLIVCFVAFMTLINGILPTINYALISDNLEKYYNEMEVAMPGTYSIYSKNSVSDALEEVPADIDWYTVYYKDESGAIKPVETDENGYIVLEGGMTVYYVKGMELSPQNVDDASLIERLITSLLMMVGSALYGLVCLVIGEEFSIEKVIFNNYGNTKLSFFTNGMAESNLNPFIENNGIRSVLNDFFNFFTGIALAVYLIILVYMAIRIMLGSTAEKGSKHKQLIMYWLEGILILFLFPYVMKFSIQINDSFISFVGANKGSFIAEPVVEADKTNKLENIPDMVDSIKDSMKYKHDYMSIMYKNAVSRGWLVFAICWYVMFFQMIGFLFVYFKRVLVMMFLIAVFPLVMISYAIDKIGDAKSQAFNNWVKEFMINVFIQSFHVIAYVLIMSLISVLMGDPSENWLIILIAISFISKGDDILRAIFSLNSGADTIKGIGATVAQVAAVSSINKGIRSMANRLVGPNSKPRAVINGVGNISQKLWDKADNRVTKTAKEIELAEINLPQNLNANLLSPEEIEKNLRADINNLLGKNKDATAENIRNSADRLTAYMNQTNNANAQSAIDKLAKELSPAERKALDNLLKQNVATNKLMAGGKEINITQNVNIIVSCLKRNADGTLTKESKALLNKIAQSETDLQAIKLFGNVKFNKESRKEINRSTLKTGKNYIAKRNSKKVTTISRGRGGSKSRKELVNATSSLDYKMKVNGSIPTSSKEKKKITRVSNRAILPGTERASARINRAIEDERVDTNQASNKSVYKVVKKETKTWDNVKSMKDSSHAQTSGVSGNAASSLENKLRYSATALHTVRGKEHQVREETNITSRNVNASSNTKQNVGENIANKQGSAENLEKIISKEEYVSRADKILNETGKNRSFESAFGKIGPKEEVRVSYSNLDKGLQGYIDENIKNKPYSKAAKKDFESAVRSIAILGVAGEGDFTAKELLDNVKSLKRKVRKYETHGVKERMAMEDVIKQLGYRLEDYESYLRIKILNDPDSVGNNREIIEECKEYVKNTPMPSTIRNKLGYNLDDLKEGVNLKYVRSRDTSNDGIILDEQKTRMQEEFEAELKARTLRKEIEDLDKKNEEDYSGKEFAKDAWKIGFDALKAHVDIVATGVSAGIGAVTTGMTTDGKKETMSQAATGFFTGYNVANEIYENSINSIVDFAKDTKDVFVDDIQIDEKEEEKEAKQAEIEDIIDKTEIKTSSFEERGRSKKK